MERTGVMGDRIRQFWNAGRRTAANACLLIAACSVPALADTPKLDHLMDHDPALPVQATEYALPPEWQSLWQQALEAPEEDLRREAAEAIARAHRLGSTGLDPFPASLRTALASSKNPTVRLTIAAALIELDARDAAAELAQIVASGGDRESLVIEPALARWNYDPFRQIWRERLTNPQNTTRRRLLLAIDAIGVILDPGAEPTLRLLALDRRRPAEVRLPAANVVGALHTDDVIDDARRLADDTSPQALVDRLVAVALLGSDREEPAQQLLAQLALDPQSAVAAIAIEKLLAIDPLLVQPLVPQLLNRPEGQLRQLAARSLFERPAVEHIATLGRLLDDPHLDVRSAVREHLRELATQPQLRDAVIAQASQLLRAPGWRGQEQAVRLVGELDLKAEAPRITELLESEQEEVYVTAAWALARLAVPETLPAMQTFAERMSGLSSDPAAKRAGPLSAAEDACLSHLFQAFGVMKHTPAEPILLEFVPRQYDKGILSRSGAVWALGHLHAGDPQLDLARMFGERAADDGDIPAPEPIEVRTQAAIALGRMEMSEAIEILRLVYNRANAESPLRAGSRWAIEQITGNALPETGARQVVPASPFLQPLGP